MEVVSKHEKSVLVTGATGSVGESVVRHFRRRYPECRLFGTYKSDLERAQAVGKECSAVMLPLNGSDASQLDALPSDVSILVNCAGVNLASTGVIETDRDVFERTYDVNLRLPVALVQKYLPFMVGQRWGRIVNVNSIWGIRGSVNNLSYNISKHGLTGLTRTVALEYFRHGVTVNDVCPGPIESRMMNAVIQRGAEARGVAFEEEHTRFCASLRMGRMVTPDEVAAVVLFVCSDEASGVNGAAIPIDGGMTI